MDEKPSPFCNIVYGGEIESKSLYVSSDASEALETTKEDAKEVMNISSEINQHNLLPKTQLVNDEEIENIGNLKEKSSWELKMKKEIGDVLDINNESVNNDLKPNYDSEVTKGVKNKLSEEVELKVKRLKADEENCSSDACVEPNNFKESNNIVDDQMHDDNEINTQTQCATTSNIKDETIKLKVKHPLEPEVGISEYIGKHTGFHGILKHRYSDFLVNEITPEGEIVRLTTFDIPIESAPENDTIFTLRDILNEDVIEKIEKLANGEASDICTVSIKAGEIDKENRTKIHDYIKINFQSLTSCTEMIDNERIILVRALTSHGKKKRMEWPRTRPNFTHFVMYKENCDTLEAINHLSRMIRMNPGALTYAGTKDKRGKTSQLVSVKRVEGKRLLCLNKGLNKISLGNICYKSFALKLGDLAGNQFTIILREIDATDVDLIISMTSLKDRGFINYYGMQRFGTTQVPTHEVGRALIQEKWQDAIDLILQPRSGDSSNMNACRKMWAETKNAKKALSILYQKESVEGQLLKGIMEHNANDLVNALNNISRNMRLMYIHSYQSYIWNSIVSKRIAMFGLEPKVGDLYIISEKDDSHQDSVVGDKLKLKKDEKPNIVTQKDIDEKLVSIYDIVLPLPGNSITYPLNEVEQWYKDILAKDEMNMNSFISKVKSYSLSGTYRHMLVKPKNVKWSVLSYNMRDEELILSDWDILNGTELTLEKTGKFQALKLQFDLPSSSYATMAIREVTKRDTSVWAQKNM